MNSLCASAALALALAASPAAADLDNTPLIFPPLNDDPSLETKMIVFTPGGLVPIENYTLVVEAVQERTELNLWFAVINCHNTAGLCNPLDGGPWGVNALMLDAIDRVNQTGFDGALTNGDIFVGGHSLGGIGATYFGRNHDGFAGLFVLGSYVEEPGSDYDLLNYPMPVALIGAELDGGMACPGKMSLWYRQHLELAESEGEDAALASRPVVILPEIDHSDFCPGFNVSGDLPSEVDYDTAMERVGGAISSFINLQTEQSQEVVDLAMATLRSDLAFTSELLDGYLKAADLEKDGWCETAQRAIADLSAEDDARLFLQFEYRNSSSDFEHFHTNYSNFTDKSGLVNLEVAIGGNAAFPSDWFETGMLTSADEIGCKLISADRVAEQMSVTPASLDVQCADVNKMAYEQARALASDSTLARFDATGKPITYKDDWQVSIGPQFIFVSSLKMDETDNSLVVQSPKDYTALDSAFYPGQHYCKLLSPARVLDWMMTTGLPNRFE